MYDYFSTPQPSKAEYDLVVCEGTSMYAHHTVLHAQFSQYGSYNNSAELICKHTTFLRKNKV